MPLIRLIYASVARDDLDLSALMAILEEAEAKNHAKGITGALVFSNRYFLQILEGERSLVNRLYLRITQDPRHRDCEILDCSQISSRRFAEWSMKHIGWDDTPTERRRELLLTYAGSSVFDPRQLTGKQAYGFLLALGDLERRRAA